MTRRAVLIAGAAAALLCGVAGVVVLRSTQAHGLVHAAEAGNVERVRAAIEREPRDAGLWELLGEAYSARSEHAQAVQAYQRSIQLDGANETTWWMMGIAEVCRSNVDGVAAAERGLRKLNEKSAQEFARLAPLGCRAFGGHRE